MSAELFPWRTRLPMFLAALLILLTGCSMATQTREQINLLTPAPMPVEALQAKAPPAPPDVAVGASIYAQKCLPCHGDTGLGNGPKAAQVRAQGGQVAKIADASVRQQAKPSNWFQVISNGRIQQLMPGFADSLSPQERWDVLGYVWALGVTSQTLQAGNSLYTTNCVDCHGAQGKGDGPKVGNLKAGNLSDPTYIAANSLNDISMAMSQGDAHRQVKLDNPQRQQVAEYVRSFGFPYIDPSIISQQAAQSQGQGILQLHAENLTTHAKPVANLPVTLHAYDTTGEVFSRTAILDQSGIVTFTNLLTASTYFYQADATYNGAKTFSSPAQFSETLSITSTLPVYEVTTDPGVIRISQFHYFVQGANDGSISVVEFYIFDNTSDRAFIDKPGPGGQLRTLKVTIPTDAVNLRFDGPGIGDRFSQDGNTLYDSDAVPPGQRASTIALIYDLPYKGDLHIERNIAYAVNTWDVLLPEGTMQVTGLVDKGAQQMQNGTIHLYAPNQPSLPAGSNVVFNLTGQLGTPQGTGSTGAAIGLGLVALAIAGAMAYFVVSHSRASSVRNVEPERERHLLLQQIAELDTQYAHGKLTERTYHKQREELKDELRDIWR